VCKNQAGHACFSPRARRFYRTKNFSRLYFHAAHPKKALQSRQAEQATELLLITRKARNILKIFSKYAKNIL
jgi:hypothetical protein